MSSFRLHSLFRLSVPTMGKPLIARDCYYCGSPPEKRDRSKTRSGEITWNGVDRVDNTQGYTLENSRPCCKICNHLKGSLSEQQFIERVKKIAARHAGVDPRFCKSYQPIERTLARISKFERVLASCSFQGVGDFLFRRAIHELTVRHRA